VKESLSIEKEGKGTKKNKQQETGSG